MTANDRAEWMMCPDAEVLSCFIDGELPGDRAAAVQTHLSHCSECADVLSQMQSLGARTNRDGCPDGESLAGYLIGGLADAEERDVDAHASTCDTCVRALGVMRRQLQRSWALDAPIPVAIVERARTLARPGTARSLSLMRHPPQPPTRVPAYFRLPVLMPAAFAAGVAFFVAINAANLGPRGRPEQTRGASAFVGNRRVTAAETLMRSEPSDTAAVVARVARGLAVEVQAEEREWLRVSLPTREQGWVPRRAFE